MFKIRDIILCEAIFATIIFPKPNYAIFKMKSTEISSSIKKN